MQIPSLCVPVVGLHLPICVRTDVVQESEENSVPKVYVGPGKKGKTVAVLSLYNSDITPVLLPPGDSTNLWPGFGHCRLQLCKAQQFLNEKYINI